MTWASDVIDCLTTLSANIEAQNVTYLASFNGTVIPNKTFFEAITVPGTGMMTVQTSGNTSEAAFGLYKNTTFAYFNESAPLSIYSINSYTFYVRDGDTVNFIYNQSIGTVVEVYWKSG